MITHRFLAAVAALAAVAGSANAQEPPDDTRPVLIFSDILVRGAPAYVVLAQGTAYRIEVVPSRVGLVIRAAGRPTAPPLVMRPLEDAAVVEGGTSYLIVPVESAEYRIEVPEANEAVRVRIVRDPRETRLLAGQARAPRGVLTLGVRAVAMLGNVQVVRADVAASPGAPASADSAVTGSAVGVEACLGVATGRFVPFPRLDGCILTVGAYSHSGGAGLLLVGTAPRYMLSASRRAVQMALAGHLAVGKAGEPFRRDAVYLVAGMGLSMAAAVGGLELEVVPGLALVQRGSYNRSTPFGTEQARAATAIVPRVSAGLHVRL